MPDISMREQRLCELLAPLLREHAVGDSLGDLLSAGDLMTGFEFFLPEFLRGVHNEPHDDFLDGVYPRIFRKIGDRDAELVGLAIFISDQTLTPIHFQLQLSRKFDRVAWLDLRLGERTEQGCLRETYSRQKVSGTMLNVAKRYESIDWYYHVDYGERQT